MKTKGQERFQSTSVVCLCVFLLTQLCATPSGLAQQWHSPHSIPVFRGTEAQDLTLKTREAQQQCLSNLQQLGIALRVYASDNMDKYPTNWPSCETEIVFPSVLVCPTSPYQYAGTNWSEFNFSRASYTLFPGSDVFPNSLCIACNYHSNYSLGDGSAHFAKPYTLFPAARKGTFHFPDHVLSVAHKHAEVISCINNLKQIGIACRVYATDNGDRPPTNFASMETALVLPQVLYCPASDITEIPTNFSTVDYSQISYTMTPAPEGSPDNTPYVTCRYHGNYSLSDGSAHIGTNAFGYPGIIVGNPISQTVDPGATATLKVRVAYPPETLSFQWRRQTPFDAAGGAFTNTVAIPGATNATLNLTNCTSGEEGYYDVVVSTTSSLKEMSAMTYLAIQPLSTISFDESLGRGCCSNNLFQISLTSRIAIADQVGFPTNKTLYSACLGWPLALLCPSDSQRTPPETWDAFELSDSSYGINFNIDENSTTNVLAWCKFHHSYVQADGKVVFPDELKILGITPSAGNNILNWTGGVAPYQVLMSTSLTPPNWTVVADSISETSLPLPNTNATAFYRVVYQLH